MRSNWCSATSTAAEAISASSLASGSMFTAQSVKKRGVPLVTTTYRAEAIVLSGSRRMIWSAGLIVSG